MGAPCIWHTTEGREPPLHPAPPCSVRCRSRTMRRSAGLGRLVACQRLLVTRPTDPHLATPRCRLHQDRWRIQAVLADMAHKGGGSAGPAPRAGARAGVRLRSRHRGGSAPQGRYDGTVPRGRRPPCLLRARFGACPHPWPAPAFRACRPLPSCDVLPTPSAPSPQICATRAPAPAVPGHDTLPVLHEQPASAVGRVARCGSMPSTAAHPAMT